MQSWLKHNISLNLLFALSYFLLAKLGFVWGALTANATLFWPASGLAVFGFLLFGKRVLPGLLLGGIAANEIISLAPGAGYNSLSLAVASLSALASIAQALIITRYTQPAFAQNFSVAFRQALQFVLLAVISCTLSATISNLAIWQAGYVDAGGAMQSWAVWWLGDSIGVLVVAPALLWIFALDRLRKNTQGNAFLIFSTGIGIILLIVAAIGHNERDLRQKNLLRDANSLRLAWQTNIDFAKRDLDMLQEYFLNSPPSREDFKTLTEPLLKRNAWLDGFSWLTARNSAPTPNTGTGTSAAPQQLTLEFNSGLMLAREADNNFVWQTPNPQSYSAQLLANISQQPHTAFSDIYWRPISNSSGSAVATPTITLANPIYFCTNNSPTDCKIYNVISSDINLNNAMLAALQTISTPKLAIQLLINPGSNKTITLAWEGDHWQRDRVYTLTNSPIKINGKLPSIQLGDNEWQLQIAPKNIYLWFLPSVLQLIVLALGSTIIGLLTAYLYALHRHDLLIRANQRQLEQEIHTQTESLMAANDWLLKEIAERRSAQEQLKASEHQMRVLLDSIPDPIWYKTIDGTYLNVNKAVGKIFAQDPTNIIGKSASDFADKELANAINAIEQQALTTDKAVRKELWMYFHAQHEKRLMDTIKIAVRDEHNKALGILSIAHDITDKYALINELEKFQRFAEFASEGFAIMSLSTRVLYMNRSMKKMLHREAESGDKDILEHMPAELRQHWQNDIFPQILLQGSWKGELEALRSDGVRFPTKETFFVIRDDKGSPLYLGKVMRDISEQKRVEAALKLAKQAAEEATQAKSRFLANMSHEIRTPLNAVLGYSQLLMADPQLSATQRERMSAILNAGQRLLNLINDVLDLSKIEAGALHLRQDYFDLQQELNEIIALMQSKATTKGLQLSSQIELPSPAIVHSDRQKIGQIILNLLGNAIKFTRQGEVSFTAQIDSQGISFAITDTGPGIAAQELQQLFTSFKQGKAGEESGGTGLGLVIAKHIAQSLGGDLLLESQPGKGTRALLRLPLQLEQDAPLPQAPQKHQPHLAPNASCRVLVVEDDPASRDLLLNLLMQIGCEVSVALNGKEGLEKMLAQPFDIVFTDIRMPELSGTAMLHQVRKHIAPQQLPIIAVSASSLEHERTYYLGQGFHEFIGKPYQFNDIYLALSQFTQAEFIQQPTDADEASAPPDTSWQTHPEPALLRNQLDSLRCALNSGDLQNSKKLFAQQSAQSLGKAIYQQLQHALRQYDLVGAEILVANLLAELDAQLEGGASAEV